MNYFIANHTYYVLLGLLITTSIFVMLMIVILLLRFLKTDKTSGTLHFYGIVELYKQCRLILNKLTSSPSLSNFRRLMSVKSFS